MHPEARLFVEYCARVFKDHFVGASSSVLDVGSGDINGNNSIYFEKCASYVGCDVVPGPNVHVVSPCHLLEYPPGSFDVVISTECLEHDMHYRESLIKITELLRPGGLLIITCATTGRPEHGTIRTSVQDSLTTQLGGAWAEYYKNLTYEDIDQALPGGGLQTWYTPLRSYINTKSRDLYLVAVRKHPDLPRYEAEGVVPAFFTL